MSGILSAANPLNVVRRKVAPVLRQWEQERPNVVPGILAGALETAPIFAPTVGEMVGGMGPAILGSDLYGAMQQMEADPTRRTDLMGGMLSSPLAYPMVASVGVVPPVRSETLSIRARGIGGGRGPQIDVLKNPTQADIERFAGRDKDFRFRYTIDEAGDIYAWDGREAIHGQVVPALKVTPSMGGEGADATPTAAEFWQFLDNLSNDWEIREDPEYAASLFPGGVKALGIPGKITGRKK